MYVQYYKKCGHCKEWNFIIEFYGKSTRCKTCDKESSKRTYKKHIEQNRLKRKLWYIEHRALRNKHQRLYNARKREDRSWGLL